MARNTWRCGPETSARRRPESARGAGVCHRPTSGPVLHPLGVAYEPERLPWAQRAVPVDSTAQPKRETGELNRWLNEAAREAPRALRLGGIRRDRAGARPSAG